MRARHVLFLARVVDPAKVEVGAELPEEHRRVAERAGGGPRGVFERRDEVAVADLRRRYRPGRLVEADERVDVLVVVRRVDDLRQLRPAHRDLPLASDAAERAAEQVLRAGAALEEEDRLGIDGQDGLADPLVEGPQVVLVEAVVERERGRGVELVKAVEPQRLGLGVRRQHAQVGDEVEELLAELLSGERCERASHRVDPSPLHRGGRGQDEEVARRLVHQVVAQHVRQVRYPARERGPGAGVGLLQELLDRLAVLLQPGEDLVSREEARVGPGDVERERVGDRPVGERQQIGRFVRREGRGLLLEEGDYPVDGAGLRGLPGGQPGEQVVDVEERRLVEPSQDARCAPVRRREVLLWQASLQRPARSAVALDRLAVGRQQREERVLQRAGFAVLRPVVQAHHQVPAEDVLVHVEQHVEAVVAGELDHLAHVVDVRAVVAPRLARLEPLPKDEEPHRAEAHLLKPPEVLGRLLAREGPSDVARHPVLGDRRGHLAAAADVDPVEEHVAAVRVAQVRALGLQARQLRRRRRLLRGAGGHQRPRQQERQASHTHSVLGGWLVGA